MKHELPNPKAIPGFKDATKHLPDEITLLGIEPEMSFDWKLAIYDAKIANNIESGTLEAVGRLTEFREAIIEERFILTKEYKQGKKEIIDELEPMEADAMRKENPVTADRLKFEKYRRLFRLQEQFLARNYPFKAHIKERLANWATQ
jgi:hypothetical protein